MKRAFVFLLGVGLLIHGAQSLRSQGVLEQMPLIESGKIPVNGQMTPFLIRHLPVSSFPQLPAAVQADLNRRGCLIPQTYDAHGPENVVRANLERSGSADWAVLCSAHSAVSLLVFFADGAQPMVLATAQETQRLEPHGADGALGFDWGIDAVSPKQVYEAQIGMKNRPALLDHDALAESILDQTTLYHYFNGSTWTLVQTRD